MFVILKCLGIRNSYKISVSRPFCLQNASVATAPEERIKQKAAHVAELLDCSIETAILLISKNPKILSLNDDTILRSTAFCAKNMRLSDVVENPSIISTPHRTLHQRLYTLKEVGGNHVRGSSIARFMKIMNEAFKVPTSTEMVPCAKEPLMKILTNCTPTEVSEISSKLTEMYDKNLSLSTIKGELNIQYLMLLFKCQRERLDFVVKRYPFLLVQSIESMDSTLKVLTEKLGFTIQKLYYCPYLLAYQDFHIENILKTVPSMLDVSIHVLARKNPALLKRSPAMLQAVEVALKEFGVNGRQLVCCPRVLEFSQKTLRKRLQALHDSEDFSVFKTFRNFLFLVCNYKKLHSRVELIKEANLPFSLSMLILSKPSFNRMIMMSKGHSYSKDISNYLAELYNCDEKSIRTRLCYIPNIYYTCIMDACKVIRFLFEQGISKEQLWNGLAIITFKPQLVENVFFNLPYYSEFHPFSEWKNHFNLIQLLIYTIQKVRKDINRAQSSLNKNVILETDGDSYDLVKEFEVDIAKEFPIESDIEGEIDDVTFSDEEEEEESLISDAHKL